MSVLCKNVGPIFSIAVLCNHQLINSEASDEISAGHEFVVATTGRDGTIKIWNFRPTTEESKIIGDPSIEYNEEKNVHEEETPHDHVEHMDVDRNNENI